jgi:hypothetical protein
MGLYYLNCISLLDWAELPKSSNSRVFLRVSISAEKLGRMEGTAARAAAA